MLIINRVVFFIKKYIIVIGILVFALHSDVCAQYVHTFDAENYSKESIIFSAKFWSNNPEESLIEPLSGLRTIELLSLEKALLSSNDYPLDGEFYGIHHSARSLHDSKNIEGLNYLSLSNEITTSVFPRSVLEHKSKYFTDLIKLSAQSINEDHFDQTKFSFEKSFFYFLKQKKTSSYIEPFSCDIDLPTDQLPEDEHNLQPINVGKGTNYRENSSKFLSYREVLYPYPQYSEFTSPFSLSKYNIFENNFEKTFSLVDSSKIAVEIATTIEPTITSSIRQRRANWDSTVTYTWEMDDFDPNATHAKLGVTNFNAPFPDNPGYFNLDISANNGLGSLAVLAYGTTGGNALNDYLHDDTNTNGFLFMTATGWNVSGDITNKFNIRTNDLGGGNTGIDSWLNGFDNYDDPKKLWGVWKNGDNFYLTYEFSNLNFSPVPEPSTYFMTGALFCLIGCNRSSRNAFKLILHKTFNFWKTKPQCQDIQKPIS